MKPKLIIGLGNPGRQYERTRHNAGFMAVDFLAKQLKLTWREDKKLGTMVAHAKSLDGTRDKVILAKPLKLMNNSGGVVSRLVRHFNAPVSDLLVIYDDVDLPLGELRQRERGSSAGHRGMQSIIEALGTSDISRLRIGIGRPSSGAIETSEFVLKPFTATELTTIKTALSQIYDQLLVE